MVISALISAGILVLCAFKIKSQRGKEYVLRFFAVITVVIHFSSLWVDFFVNGEAKMQESMLFPIHPCNVCMWMLLIVAFCKNREGIFGKTLSEFAFWGGTVCGFVGILLNVNFDSNPTLADYEVLKGLLSHSTMLIGCIYILVAKFIKIRVANVRSVVLGLCFFVMDGLIINTLYRIFEIDECNSMYLLEPPMANLPWLNTWFLGVVGVLICFSISALYEQLFLKEEERWYKHIKIKSE